MPCILTHIDANGVILAASTHTATKKLANECSPKPGEFVAFYKSEFKKLSSGYILRQEQSGNRVFKDWIKKIEEADVPNKSCNVQLKTDHPNEMKTHMGINCRTDVKNAMHEAAKKRGYSITGLIETIFINWLNANETGKKLIASPTRATEQSAYNFGLLVAKEFEIYGKVDLSDCIFNSISKTVNRLKKSFIRDNKYTPEIGGIINTISSKSQCVPLHPHYYIWFFAGFCGIDWATIAEQKI